MDASAVDQLERARVLHRAGVAASDDGRLGDAGGLLTEALGLLGLDPNGDPAPPASAPNHVAERDRALLTARILISLALPRYELGDVGAGLKVLARAEQVADRRSVAEVAPLIHCQRGLLLVRAGRPQEALPHLDHAVRLLAAASPLEQCKILMNRGEVHHMLGRIRAAERDYAQATEIARAAGEPEFVFRNTHNTGYMAYLTGDLPRALRTMPTVAEATSDYARGVVGLDRPECCSAPVCSARPTRPCSRRAKHWPTPTCSRSWPRSSSPAQRRPCWRGITGSPAAWPVRRLVGSGPGATIG